MPVPATTAWLRANTAGRPTEVDRESNVLRGYVVAQAGPFKDGRGEFDLAALKEIVKLGNRSKAGLKSRFGHPTLSDDGLGKFLGRAKRFALDETGPIPLVRADLEFNPTASATPHGDLAQYVLDLAESDSDAVSSSLVLNANETDQVDKKGNPVLDDKGNRKPPLWFPTRLHASDIVDTGAAVDGILSAGAEGLGYAGLSIEGLPDELVRRAAMLFDRQFEGCDRATVEARALSWLGRYLDARYGASQESPSRAMARRRAKLRLLDS